MAMASAHCTTFSLLAPSTTTRRTPRLFLISSKLRHRKNYLRPKILKTLTKPYPPLLPLPPPSPSPPPQPIPLPQPDDLRVEIPSTETLDGDIIATAEEPVKLEESQVSEAIPERNGVIGDVSATHIFKYGGMYLVGAFVFQTIFSFFILRNYESNQKDRDLDINGRENRNILLNGNGKTMPLSVTGARNDFHVEDQLRMEKKIEEIKLMAREVRRIELENKGEENGHPEMDDESTVSSHHRLGIEKEIGACLLKLQNRINNNKDNSVASQINNTHGNSGTGVARDSNENVDQGNEALVFKKKFKYRSPSTKAIKTPKGFSGTRNRKASDAKKTDSAAQDHGSDAADHTQMLDEDKQGNQQDIVSLESISSLPSEERGNIVDAKSEEILNHGNNLEENMQTTNTETEVGIKTESINNGGVQETNIGLSSLEALQSSKLDTQKSQGSVGENLGIRPNFEKDDVHHINGSSRHGLAKKNPPANRVKVKQAKVKNDMWWLKLRYVIVILMQRSSDGGSKGLYSLKYNSKEQDQSDDSYTVAFEDHADANNFCFLLESFFADLGDFIADAVPMSIQELNEELISRAKKVVVVKKRQLQLYAGQPLTDVEMSLCSIIEQDQKGP